MNRVITKLTSGQWILTVSFAFTFSWLACHGMLDKEDVMVIGSVIVYAYFKRDRNDEDEKKPNS